MPYDPNDTFGRIIGAAIEVHRKLGQGFLKAIYENALMIELAERGLRAERQVERTVFYNGVEVGKHRLDIVVGDTAIVELKAVQHIEDVHYCIVRSYLRAMIQKQGPLLNFARPTLEIKRVFNNAPE